MRKIGYYASRLARKGGKKRPIAPAIIAVALILIVLSMIGHRITGIGILGDTSSLQQEDVQEEYVLPTDGPDASSGTGAAQGSSADAAASGSGSYEFSDAEAEALSTDSDAVRQAMLSVPAWDGETPYAEVNGNIPFFGEDEITADSFESYSDLDSLGRCGVAYACLGKDLMPTETRGDISSVTPSGWCQTAYDDIDGGYLYNRCHLIAFELAGENANEKNLITGTRYFNVDGMLPFENMVADYIRETGNHVMYRVSPLFVGDELVARGVLMEGLSVEDGGESIDFCVWCYNAQPGISIDYADGSNAAE